MYNPYTDNFMGLSYFIKCLNIARHWFWMFSFQGIKSYDSRKIFVN